MMLIMSNSINKTLMTRMSPDPRSIVGKHLQIICDMYDINNYQLRNSCIHGNDTCKYVNEIQTRNTM